MPSVPLAFAIANLASKRQHVLELNTDLSLTGSENLPSLCKYSDHPGSLSVKCEGKWPPPLVVGRTECV